MKLYICILKSSFYQDRLEKVMSSIVRDSLQKTGISLAEIDNTNYKFDFKINENYENVLNKLKRTCFTKEVTLIFSLFIRNYNFFLFRAYIFSYRVTSNDYTMKIFKNVISLILQNKILFILHMEKLAKLMYLSVSSDAILAAVKKNC